MNPIDLNDIKKYVEENIGFFHKKRIEKLSGLKLKDVLKRKNPYLFRVKNVLTAQDLIEGIVSAFISSSEEGIFGDWLEGLAIFVNQKVYGGWKSSTTGIDLEFDHDNTRYIVSIKSGPNWGNSSQIKKMVDNFNTARRTLRTSGSKINIIAVNGCCYGKTTKKNSYKEKGDYFKYCGQAFWEFISGDSNLYKEIIAPLGYLAQQKNDEYEIAYSKKINQFTSLLAKDFFTTSGEINWEKLAEFNSQEEV